MAVTVRRISGAADVAARKNPNSRDATAIQTRRPMNRQAMNTIAPRIATKGIETIKVLSHLLCVIVSGGRGAFFLMPAARG
jgi:hypothetical protein